jgi:DNA-binding XRE family transcriptional regulator
MSFDDFIKVYGGCEMLGKKLGVSKETVRRWRNRSNAPSVRNAVKLIKLSKGSLSWRKIYNDYYKARK